MENSIYKTEVILPVSSMAFVGTKLQYDNFNIKEVYGYIPIRCLHHVFDSFYEVNLRLPDVENKKVYKNMYKTLCDETDSKLFSSKNGGIIITCEDVDLIEDDKGKFVKIILTDKKNHGIMQRRSYIL